MVVHEGMPIIYVISDSLGETAELVARAAASQFNSGHMEIRRIPYVADKELLTSIVEEASRSRGVVAHTLVLPDLKEHLMSLVESYDVPAVDLLGPMIKAIAEISPVPPRLEPGLLRRLDEEYFRKIEAVEFAVKYDDGKDPRGLILADVILIGVSRTSKTPVAMYLAHKQVKAANVPLVPEVSPPEELFKVPKRKIIGFTIAPGLLNQIRKERLRALGLEAGADYANPERILRELDYAHEVMRELGCPVIDVTNRAIEETATRVLEIYYKGERYGH